MAGKGHKVEDLISRLWSPTVPCLPWDPEQSELPSSFCPGHGKSWLGWLWDQLWAPKRRAEKPGCSPETWLRLSKDLGLHLARLPAGSQLSYLMIQPPWPEVARSSHVETLIDRVREPYIWLCQPRICGTPQPRYSPSGLSFSHLKNEIVD